MDVGTVIRKEVGWGELSQALVGKTLNLEHEFVQDIIKLTSRGGVFVLFTKRSQLVVMQMLTQIQLKKVLRVFSLETK